MLWIANGAVVRGALLRACDAFGPITRPDVLLMTSDLGGDELIAADESGRPELPVAVVEAAAP